MVNAQVWLDREYPEDRRNNITNLLICNKNYETDQVFQSSIAGDRFSNIHYLHPSVSLTGTLNLSSFPRLEKLRIKGQLIGKLVLTDCQNLKEISAEDNLLRTINLPSQAENLKRIDLTNNSFYPQDLSCFSRFSKLRYLYLGTYDRERIRQGIYNRWNGSLIHLENLTKLEDLSINTTDIDSGLEYLPTRRLIYFVCGDKGRTNAGVNRIKEFLDFDEETAESEDIDENLAKVEEIRYWQEQQEIYQNQIEVNR